MNFKIFLIIIVTVISLILFFLMFYYITIVNYNKKNKNVKKTVKKIYKNTNLIKNPKISVIIPVFNSSKWLKECLSNVINQTLKEIEIICVNDGSTDSSLKILLKYLKKDSRIVIVDKENGGVSSARNEGLKIASGKFIMFLDNDDYYSLDACEKCFNSIVENKTDMAAFGWCNFCDDECENKKKHEKICGNHKFVEKPKIFKKSEEGLYFDHAYLWTKIYKAEIAKKINFINLKIFEDSYWLYAIYSKCNSVVFNPEIIYFRRLHNSNFSLQRNLKSLVEMLKGVLICSHFLNKNFGYSFLKLIKYYYSCHIKYYNAILIN